MMCCPPSMSKDARRKNWLDEMEVGCSINLLRNSGEFYLCKSTLIKPVFVYLRIFGIPCRQSATNIKSTNLTTFGSQFLSLWSLIFLRLKTSKIPSSCLCEFADDECLALRRCGKTDAFARLGILFCLLRNMPKKMNFYMPLSASVSVIYRHKNRKNRLKSMT